MNGSCRLIEVTSLYIKAMSSFLTGNRFHALVFQFELDIIVWINPLSASAALIYKPVS